MDILTLIVIIAALVVATFTGLAIYEKVEEKHDRERRERQASKTPPPPEPEQHYDETKDDRTP